jgi:cyclopropane-fatty-acyl-phospholipid synthase
MEESNQAHATTRWVSEVVDFRGPDVATSLLQTLFRHVDACITIRLWEGSKISVGARARDAACDSSYVLAFRTPEAIWSMILKRDPLQLVEAYFCGDLEIEGDFFAALRIKDHLDSFRLPAAEFVKAMVSAMKLRALNRAAQNSARRAQFEHGHVQSSVRHSKAHNRDAIRYHYDVSNEFYALWLGRSMVYSCAYFQSPDQSLDDAQQAKLDHICRKLRLGPDDHFLDIGCGWGSLVVHAAKHYGVRAHGITLSRKQFEFARARIAAEGLTGRVGVDYLDYRDLTGESIYDKVASVGMFEHVGLRNLPTYFETVRRVLKPGGLFLNHGITHEREGWQENLSTQFINRYVFPDGELDTIGNVQRAMERAGFEIADVEALRPHYALTLRRWVSELERRHTRALEYVDEAAYRVWRLYMSACALDFESGGIGVYQVLAGKRCKAPLDLPLTRSHLYVP